MIRENWSLFLVDFGIAKEQVLATTGTKLLGTPYCMAPEMFQQTPKSTRAIDIYGLGIVFFELLTREIPQIPKGVTSASGWRPKIPADKARGCPLGYVELMKACWSQDAKKRPSLDDIISQLSEMKKPETLKDLDALLALYPKHILLVIVEYLQSPTAELRNPTSQQVALPGFLKLL